ncbi:MAG TPA: M81 family metallopeptidase [Candidatus Limnocylindria bacterium]|nr:M81 family metallopeptidase [Candidatus Limnocylindria bacterium]
MRIAVGGFSHETNTFNPAPTTRRWFERIPGRCWHGEEMWPALRGGHPVLSGFLEGAASAGHELVPAFYTAADPTTGTISDDTLEWIAESLVASLRAARPDGVLLDLHGAAVSERHRDAEAEVVGRVRAALGPNVPIVAVNDAHGNVGAAWLDYLDAAVAYKRIPHTDRRERGLEAVRLLARILAREVEVTAAIARPPLVVKSGLMSMSEAPLMLIKPPMFWLTRRAAELERQPGVLNVSVNVGFGDADTEVTGLSVVAHTDRDPELARALADEVARLAWRLRRGFGTELVMMLPAEAVERALSTPDWPVVLADEGNNTAGGSPGDGTVLLAELKRQGWPEAALFIRDADAVARCVATGVGAMIDLEVGGKLEPTNGDPVAVSGRVQLLSEGVEEFFGSSTGCVAVVRCGATDLILTEYPTRQTSPAIYRRFGVEPRQKRIAVVQSAHVFRHEWETVERLPRSIIEVDTPGITSPDPRKFTYRHLPRPIYPLDEFEWDAAAAAALDR